VLRGMCPVGRAVGIRADSSLMMPPYNRRRESSGRLPYNRRRESSGRLQLESNLLHVLRRCRREDGAIDWAAVHVDPLIA